MRSLLADGDYSQKEKMGVAEGGDTETFCQGYNRSLPEGAAAERRAAAYESLLNTICTPWSTWME